MGLSTPDERKRFAKRLIRACDSNPHIPPVGMGRQAAIASTLNVVPEAVSRWFAGETMPNNARVRDLAKLLGVDVGWLTLGMGDESPVFREAGTKRMSASIMLVRALLMMHEISIVDVPENDPGMSTISMYVVIQNQLVPLIVASAMRLREGTYEATIPVGYTTGRVIVVIPRGVSPVLLLPSEMAIKRHKRPTPYGLSVIITDAGSGIFTIADKRVVRLRNFEVLGLN